LGQAYGQIQTVVSLALNKEGMKTDNLDDVYQTISDALHLAGAQRSRPACCSS
jgi:hypothetical protein